jgi:hypothetical protein
MQQLVTLLFIVEVSYVLVGLDLLRRARTTRGLPELFLGLAFIFNGLSYLFADLPTIIDNEAFVNEFSYTGRIFAALCSLTIAVFTWRAFRAKASWAMWLSWMVGGLLLSGLTVSALESDWQGASPMTYKGFWFEWVGGAVPFIWLAIESLYSYVQSRRRVRIGLSDPLVCNRFFLIGLYGLLASFTYPIYLWMYFEYERSGFWSEPLTVFAGFIEVFSLVALWTSFAAPAFYRRWVGESQTSA